MFLGFPASVKRYLPPSQQCPTQSAGLKYCPASQGFFHRQVAMTKVRIMCSANLGYLHRMSQQRGHCLSLMLEYRVEAKLRYYYLSAVLKERLSNPAFVRIQPDPGQVRVWTNQPASQILVLLAPVRGGQRSSNLEYLCPPRGQRQVQVWTGCSTNLERSRQKMVVRVRAVERKGHLTNLAHFQKTQIFQSDRVRKNCSTRQGHFHQYQVYSRFATRFRWWPANRMKR